MIEPDDDCRHLMVLSRDDRHGPGVLPIWYWLRATKWDGSHDYLAVIGANLVRYFDLSCNDYREQIAQHLISSSHWRPEDSGDDVV